MGGRRLLAAVVLAAAVLAVALVLLLGGKTVDPFQYTARKQTVFEQRAAAGESHLLYENSPGGVVATARRVAALDAPLRAAAAASHVDPTLLEGMVFLESGGRTDAIAGADPAAAAGVAQILPGTAQSLLGMHVDLAASRRLTKQIAGAQQAHDTALVAKLERERRRADERFDPNKSLAATGRYLTFALTKLDRTDLAVESYHMGVGNLANVVRAYAGERALADKVVRARKLTYAQVYFDSTPFHNKGSFRLLAALGDDSDTYYWRVLAARNIMSLYRQDPAALNRLNALQTRSGAGEAVLHPPGSTTVFADPAALRRALSTRVLRPIPEKPADRHFSVDPALGAQARQAGVDPSLYATLRPEALAVLYYIAGRVHAMTREKAPLVVAAAARDAAHEQAHGYSLYTTGYSFDIKRRYASVVQAEAFQAMLNRLQALDAITWARRPDSIHITVSGEARPLIPLIDGASLGDES
jgi:hypothetical protein